jgi:hypothetical protein
MFCVKKGKQIYFWCWYLYTLFFEFFGEKIFVILFYFVAIMLYRMKVIRVSNEI